MKTSQNGINKIKKYENLKLKAYKCSAGKPTIGYGHTKEVYMGQTITKKKAEEFFREDLKGPERYVNEVNKNKKYNLNQNQFDSLVSFTYNAGPKKLKTLTQNRTKAQLPNGMKLYNKVGKKVIKGLVNRRQDEINLFNQPMGNNININHSNPIHNNPCHYNSNTYNSNNHSIVHRTNNYTSNLNRPININTNNSFFSGPSNNIRRNPRNNGNACLIF
jgi:lysozyme